MIQISTVRCGFRMHLYYSDVIDQQRARGHGFINKQKKKENNRPTTESFGMSVFGIATIKSTGDIHYALNALKLRANAVILRKK